MRKETNIYTAYTCDNTGSNIPLSRAMAQAASHRSLNMEARIYVQGGPCGIYGGKSGNGTGFFSKFLGFPLSLSFHRGSAYSYIIWGMDKGPVGGRSSETASFHRHENTPFILVYLSVKIRCNRRGYLGGIVFGKYFVKLEMTIATVFS
jgi:hypothetical protein